MESRVAGEIGRPSVETGMHDALPQTFCVHTHRSLVNGITCSRDGEAVVEELFGETAVWVPTTNPGYVLSKRIKEAVSGFVEGFGAAPHMVFIENHGLVVAADSAAEVHRIHTQILERILPRVLREPDFTGCDVALDEAERVKSHLGRCFRELAGTDPVILFDVAEEMLSRAATRSEAEALLAPFSPDHIVYAGHAPLYVENPNAVS